MEIDNRELDKSYLRAKKRVEKLKKYYSHVSIYLMVNMTTNSSSLPPCVARLLFLLVHLAWIEYLSAFLCTLIFSVLELTGNDQFESVIPPSSFFIL